MAPDWYMPPVVQVPYPVRSISMAGFMSEQGSAWVPHSNWSSSKVLLTRSPAVHQDRAHPDRARDPEVSTLFCSLLSRGLSKGYGASLLLLAIAFMGCGY